MGWHWLIKCFKCEILLYIICILHCVLTTQTLICHHIFDPPYPLHSHLNPSPLVTILLSSMSQIKYLFSARITGLKFGLQIWFRHAVPKCVIRTFTILINCANILWMLYTVTFFLLHSCRFWWNFQANRFEIGLIHSHMVIMNFYWHEK